MLTLITLDTGLEKTMERKSHAFKNHSFISFTSCSSGYLHSSFSKHVSKVVILK